MNKPQKQPGEENIPEEMQPSLPAIQVAGPPADQIPEEVSELQAVVEKIRIRLSWHEKQIEMHRMASDRLLKSLQQQLAALNEEPTEEQPAITARRLILDFIKINGGEATSQKIKEFFKSQNRRSNPSVELSRMVSEGVLNRPSRGSYALKGRK